jgi:CRISPR-associated protein Csx10
VKHFYLSVLALSPLAIRSDHAEGGTKTFQYIPGTTVRGSLAAAHQLLRPEQKDEFAALFLEQKVYFPHLYPALFNGSPSGIDTSNLPVLPLPKTAQSCKRFPGFIPLPGERTNEKQHGIRDSLLDWGIFSLLDREGLPVSALLAPFSKSRVFCKKCEQLMDHVHGYYRCGRSNPRDRMKANVNTHLQTRTGVSRDWGIVEESILYNREVFNQGMQFWGVVILPDKLAGTFKNFIAEANKEDIVCMGTGRTRGLGRINLETKEVRLRGLTDFKNRLISFDAAMRKQAQETKVRNLAPFFIAITLHSPSILCDPFIRYYSTIDEATLSNLVNHPTATFQRIYYSAGIRRICGWNELWGTPRANDYAIETGSTFLFACSQQPDDLLIQALYTLEEEGIGRRRSEGFGRIFISDPFHLEGEQI